MRIAVVGGGDVGRRSSLMLLGSAEVALLTTVGFGLSATDDRLQRADDIDALQGPLTVVVSAAEPGTEDGFAARAAELGVRLVSAAEWGLRSIATNLAIHERNLAGRPESVLAAYTVTGRPLASGEAIPFPEPVGSRWGKTVGTSDGIEVCEAATPGPWGAVSALVTGGEGTTRAVGASDLAARLAAFGLAAAALAPPQPTAYVEALLELGLEIAATTVPSRNA